MNIVEAIKEDVNSDLLAALAAANSETVEKTNTTVNTSIVSLLLAFMKRASTESGLNLLHNLSSSGSFSIHNPSDSIFPGDKINKLSDEGNALISKIIPDKKSPLITFVSSFSGVRNTTANRTNGLVTLMILNKLKQITASKSLDLAGLAELFADQKDFIVDSAPKNLIEKLSQHIGLGNLISLGSSIISTSTTLSSKNEREKQKSTENQNAYSNTETNSNSGGSSLKNWLIPGIFGLLLLGFAGYYFYNQTNSAAELETTPADSIVNINDTIKIDSLKPVAVDSNSLKAATSDTLVVEMEETTLPNGQKITLEKANLDGKLYSFLTDTSKTRTKVLVSSIPTFGAGKILPEPSKIYSNIGSIMAAFPQSRLKITVNEYNAAQDSTISQTGANKKAFSIKRVLLNSGIQSFRVDAVGSQKIGLATEAQKAKEVELLVMKK